MFGKTNNFNFKERKKEPDYEEGEISKTIQKKNAQMQYFGKNFKRKGKNKRKRKASRVRLPF